MARATITIDPEAMQRLETRFKDMTEVLGLATQRAEAATAALTEATEASTDVLAKIKAAAKDLNTSAERVERASRRRT